MKRLLIFLFSLFVSYFSVAQDNFKPGYIITNTNDSIIGWIDFRTDEANNQVCRFKPTEKAEIQLYYPGSIAKYRFINEGKYYISNSITIDKLTYLVFLEYLVSGMMNLYYYKDVVSEQEYYFFENESGTMLPITKKPDEIVDLRLKTDQRYIGTLNYLFKDYPSIQKKINSTSFSKGSFIKLTKEYHNLTCTTGEKCIDFENDYNKKYIKLKFSIYGGMQIQKYTFKEKELVIFGTTSSLFPMIGGRFYISNPRWTKSFALLADASFSGIKGERHHSDEQTYFRKYKFDALMTIGRLNIIYTYPSEKFRPVIESGFSIYNLFSKSSSMYYEVLSENIIVNTFDNYFLPKSTYVGLNCGTGFDYSIGNEQFVFCRLSFEQVKNVNIIKSGQLKFGFTF